MNAPEVPTIDEMQATYDMFSAAVDREDTLGATIYAAVCADHVAKLLKAKPLVTEESLKTAFSAGWDAAKRDENAADDEDIADAADVAFYEWLRKVE